MKREQKDIDPPIPPGRNILYILNIYFDKRNLKYKGNTN